MAAATGVIAVGAGVVLGALALAVSSVGLISLLAAAMAHAGLLCMILGVQLLRRDEIDALIGRAYLGLTVTLSIGTVGTDIAILLGQ